VSLTLMCDEDTLMKRASQRDNNDNPIFILLEQTRALNHTIKINTANKHPEEVVDEMLSVIQGVM
jgi:broad-specificity NMP kinase